MNLSRALNIEDLRRLARRRLPKAVFDYIDGGAESEITLGENCRAFRDLTFRPRGAVAFADYKLATTVLGQKLSFPAMLAPVGYSRVINPGGEVAASRVAGQAGIGYILSTISGHKLEDVKAASQGAVWYQLYLIGGRQVAERALDRAQRAGFSALVVTVDSPIAGRRERDLRNGMKELLDDSMLAKLPFLTDVLARPKWLLSFLLDGGLPRLPNIIIPDGSPDGSPMQLIDVVTALSRAAVTWQDLRWIREAFAGPIVVKGILTGDDARRAIDAGASAIVVSNHGGRQLDSVSASLRALPEVVATVNGQIEVLMDGGIRSGADIVKAICLGARAVLLGRAYAYGLGAAGEEGVARAIGILRSDVDRTLRLLGCESVAALDGSYLGSRTTFE